MSSKLEFRNISKYRIDIFFLEEEGEPFLLGSLEAIPRLINGEEFNKWWFESGNQCFYQEELEEISEKLKELNGKMCRKTSS